VSSRRTVRLVAAAFVAFSVWEIIAHIWLTDLPATTYHPLSLAVELAFIVLITLATLVIARRHIERDARLQTAQTALASALASDLRPQFIGLLGALGALQSSHPEQAGEARCLVGEAEARAAFVLDMIEDLVAMTADAQATNSRCSLVSVAEIAAQAVETLQPTAKEKGIDLQVHVPEGATIGTCRYPDAILRALLALLRHGLDSTASGGTITLKVSSEGPGRTITFSLTDDGAPFLDHAAGLDEIISGHGLVRLREVQVLADAISGSARYEPAPGGNTYLLSVPAQN